MRSDYVEPKRCLVLAQGYLQARSWASAKHLPMGRWIMADSREKVMGLNPEHYHIVQLPGWDDNVGSREAMRQLEMSPGFKSSEVLVIEELPVNGYNLD